MRSNEVRVVVEAGGGGERVEQPKPPEYERKPPEERRPGEGPAPIGGGM